MQVGHEASRSDLLFPNMDFVNHKSSPPPLPPKYASRRQQPPPTPRRQAFQGNGFRVGPAGFSDSCSNYKMDETMENQRTNAVRELIENEKLFKKQMTLVSDIMTKNRVPVSITPADLAAVKLNLDDYIYTSAQMIRAYENAVAEAPNGKLAYACVCKHLVPTLPAFRNVMVAYIKDYDPEILQHRPHLVEYFDKAGELLHRLEGQMVILSDRLLKPFQRPFHITCILHRLDKYTPELHPDSAYVKQAKIAIQKACDDAEAAKRADGDYKQYDDFPQLTVDVSAGNSAAGGAFENSRMTNYRKKGKKLSLLIEDLSKWIKLNSEDLKSFIENRRLLIKAVRELLQSLDSAVGSSLPLNFHASSVQHQIRIFDPTMFNRASEEVLDRLKLLTAPLKKMKPSLKKLKSRANDIAKTQRNRTANPATIDAYRRDEKKAMALSEAILGKTEKAIKALFLHYLSHVQRLFNYAAIKENGLDERYTKALVRLREADLKSQVEVIIAIWERQSKVAQGSNPRPNTKDAPTPAHCKARIVYHYSDHQTPPNLQVNDVVYVFRWTDAVGNPEWAEVSDRTGRRFFYPSSRLERLS
ncbi:hypothetical protein ECG_03298 [Echinococcus granulosus]|nr:hypothetical protein ECG_03298 [Echinococcus granulosus]